MTKYNLMNRVLLWVSSNCCTYLLRLFFSFPRTFNGNLDIPKSPFVPHFLQLNSQFLLDILNIVLYIQHSDESLVIWLSCCIQDCVTHTNNSAATLSCLQLHILQADFTKTRQGKEDIKLFPVFSVFHFCCPCLMVTETNHLDT